MGVPKLMEWICQKSGRSNMTTFSKENNPNNADCLYFDTSDILRDTYCYHVNKRVFNCMLFQEENKEVIFEKTIKQLMETVEQQLVLFKPKLLYLSFDGVPAIPKIVGLDQDIDLISPGTAFMKRLFGRIRTIIEGYQASNKEPWLALDVIISGAGVKGEGKFGIQTFIKTHMHGLKKTHAIFTKDTDFQLMGMAIMEDNVFTYYYHNNGEVQDRCYKKFDIGVLQDIVIKDILKIGEGHDDKAKKYRMLYDFIFMTLFMGNDYLLHLDSFKNSLHLLEHMIEHYKGQNGVFLTRFTTINEDNLHVLLQKVSRMEFMEYKGSLSSAVK